MVTGTMLFCRTKIYGRKNIPKKGSVLVLSNHQSYLDPMICQMASRRGFWYIARDTLYAGPIFGRVLAQLHTIPIRRGEADIASMRKVMEKLKQGQAVGLFPEGSRTLDGKIGVIKPGVSLFSRRTGAPVVPAVIDGAFECWPRHQKKPKWFRKGIVKFAEPISAEAIKEMGDVEFAKRLTIQLRQMQSEIRIEQGKKPYEYAENE
jgi:1-acyl-sn-glycerol-3-phosphate acyltransferase